MSHCIDCHRFLYRLVSGLHEIATNYNASVVYQYVHIAYCFFDLLKIAFELKVIKAKQNETKQNLVLRVNLVG